MALEPGTRLGPYAIKSAIGAGGMGEVYAASDTTLNRDVAVKVLRDLFAADPDRLSRFEREARLLASLNHPNIAQVYGFVDPPSSGSGQTMRALVMELVDGPTLADRIAHGASRGSPADRAPDRRSARSGARARHHPSGPQTRQYQADRGRERQGARLRPREGSQSPC